MKHIYLSLTFLLLVATSFSQTNSTMDQFRKFRDAVYHRDKATAKTFFNFPMKKASHLWYFAMEGSNDPATSNALEYYAIHDTPLTEKLFDLYFDQIFYKEFVASLLKIKTKELFETGSASTPGIVEGDGDIHSIEAIYDEKENTIHINLARRPQDPRPSMDEEVNEGSVAFIVFSIINGQLKLTGLGLAG